MTDTEASIAGLQAVEAALEVKAKKAWLQLHDDWEWILAHSWSVRFIFLAFLLTVADTLLPFLTGMTPLPPLLFGTVQAILSGAAFVARLVAQKREGVSGED